jgi:predicted transcriptional regulator
VPAAYSDGPWHKRLYIITNSAKRRPCQWLLALGAAERQPVPVTDKQAVIDALNRLLEAASLEEITEELHIMASIRRGRVDIATVRSKTHEEVEQLVDSWARRASAI